MWATGGTCPASHGNTGASAAGVGARIQYHGLCRVRLPSIHLAAPSVGTQAQSHRTGLPVAAEIPSGQHCVGAEPPHARCWIRL